MGRQSAIGGLMGKAAGKAGDKASKRRKKMGTGSFLRGGKPGDDFLAQLRQRQSAAQESARAALTQRLRPVAEGGGGERGGIFSRLFGIEGARRR